MGDDNAIPWRLSRERAELRAEESDAMFKSALMMVADSSYIATLEEGRILDVNKAFEDLLGYSRART